MRRSLGLFLLSVGILLAVLGFLGAILAGVIGGAFVALALGLAGVVGVVVIFVGRALMRGARPLGAPVEGRVGNYLADEPEARTCAGSPYEVLFKPAVQGKHGHASQLTVGVAAQAPTTLVLRRETWFDRLGKNLGIAREHQTGDVEFDEAVYIRGPSAGFAELFLGHPERRAAVLRLFDQGFQEVRLTGMDVEAVWVGFDPKVYEDPALPDDAALELFVLAEDVPDEDPDDAAARSEPQKIFKVLLWIATLGYAVTLVAAFIYPPIRVLELLAASLVAFAGVYLLFAIMAGLLLHGRSTSHDSWGHLMAWGVLLIAIGSIGAVAAVNALADTAPPREHNNIITNKRISTGRRGAKTYYVAVPAWDLPGETIEFSVSSNEYNMIAPGRSRLSVSTGLGWLGIEWQRGKQVIP
jgi:hypothetical protein